MDVTLGKYNNSLNFVFGLTGINKEKMKNGQPFDILNNPYVEILGYALDSKDVTAEDIWKMAHKYEIVKCEAEHVDRFMPKHTQDWYTDPLCFKDRDSVKVRSNYFLPDYNLPVIMLSYCRNTAENGNWCETDL